MKRAHKLICLADLIVYVTGQELDAKLPTKGDVHDSRLYKWSWRMLLSTKEGCILMAMTLDGSWFHASTCDHVRIHVFVFIVAHAAGCYLRHASNIHKSNARNNLSIITLMAYEIALFPIIPQLLLAMVFGVAFVVPSCSRRHLYYGRFA
jgi:hypothetical protein